MEPWGGAACDELLLKALPMPPLAAIALALAGGVCVAFAPVSATAPTIVGALPLQVRPAPVLVLAVGPAQLEHRGLGARRHRRLRLRQGHPHYFYLILDVNY